MAESRFFRFVWRVNAIIILAAGVAAVFAVVSALTDAGTDVEGWMRDDRVVNLAAEQVDSTWFDFDGCERTDGPHMFCASLVSFQKRSGGPDSEVRATRNYVFYDARTRTAQWLVDTNDWLFTRSRTLYANRSRDGEPRPVLALLHEFVDTDTNGDRRLTDADAISLGVSDSKGGRFTVVKRGIGDVRDYAVMSPSSVVVFYTASGELRALEISMPDFAVMHDEAIASLPAPGGAREERRHAR